MLFCFLLHYHKRMQSEEKGKQDLETFGVTTLPVTLMSLKCNQTIYLPCYLFRVSHGVVWSISICLQMGAEPVCVDFCLVVRWKTLWMCTDFYFVMATWSFCFNANNYHSTTVSLCVSKEREKMQNLLI